MSKKAIREFLTKAADKIERDGWIQGGFGNWYQPGSPTCLVGALRHIKHIDRLSDTLYGLGYHVVRERLHTVTDKHKSPPAWNDSYRCTKEKVIAFLRDCADNV